jgi:hypothetical protein
VIIYRNVVYQSTNEKETVLTNFYKRSRTSSVVVQSSPRAYRGNIRFGKIKRIAAACAACVGLFGGVATSAHANATGFSAAPGIGGYAWGTLVTRGNTPAPAAGQTNAVALEVFGGAKANMCGMGWSVWYTNVWGQQANFEQTNNGCIWGPWYTAGANLTAKHGSRLVIDFRENFQWFSGPTFGIG